MKRGSKFLSIVIPAFNEEVNFKRGVLSELKRFLEEQEYSWEVLLVDDESFDNTQNLLSEFVEINKGFKYFRIRHGGKFFAIKKGVQEAMAKHILYSDFDFSTPISEIKKMIPLVKSSDVVIAERVRNRKKDNLISKIRNRGFNFLTRLVVLPGIKDTQCGFKLFKAGVAKSVFVSTKITNKRRKSSYMGAFDVELLFLAQKAGYKIVSMPVKWKLFKSERLTMKEPFLMLIDVFRIRLHDLLGRYD